METRYYTYGDIIRVLRLKEGDPSRSLMIDVNTADGTVLSIFDASARPNDSIFIQSFLNILSESTVGFNPTTDPTVEDRALHVISTQLPDLKF